MRDGIIKAIVGDSEFEFEFRNGVLTSEGLPIDASLVQVGPSTYSLLLNGRSYELTIHANGEHTKVVQSGRQSEVRILDRWSIMLAEFEGAAKGTKHTLEVRAPMPGLVLAVEVDEGSSVVRGQGIIVLEAMKMENEIFAGGDGVVEKIYVEKGEAVTKGQLLLALAEA